MAPPKNWLVLSVMTQPEMFKVPALFQMAPPPVELSAPSSMVSPERDATPDDPLYRTPVVPPPLMARLPAPGPSMVSPLMSSRDVSVIREHAGERANVRSSPNWHWPPRWAGTRPPRDPRCSW